jgi:hypothetical protein
MPLNKAEFIYHKNIETYTKDNYVKTKELKILVFCHSTHQK